jgi:hypothetical protein
LVQAALVQAHLKIQPFKTVVTVFLRPLVQPLLLVVEAAVTLKALVQLFAKAQAAVQVVAQNGMGLHRSLVVQAQQGKVSLAVLHLQLLVAVVAALVRRRLMLHLVPRLLVVLEWNGNRLALFMLAVAEAVVKSVLVQVVLAVSVVAALVEAGQVLQATLE